MFGGRSNVESVGKIVCWAYVRPAALCPKNKASSRTVRFIPPMQRTISDHD
jgi:hypothetical protein